MPRLVIGAGRGGAGRLDTGGDDLLRHGFGGILPHRVAFSHVVAKSQRISQCLIVGLLHPVGQRQSLIANLSLAIHQPPPINAPAAKTKAPPKTTCKAARTKGVSMNLFWIHAMAQSSTNTTIMAMMVAVQKSGIR